MLDNEAVIIDGVKIIGSTLWTDFNHHNPLDMALARDSMSDYRVISFKAQDGTYHKLSPQVILREHMVSLSFIADAIRDHDHCVVITHHAPCSMSVAPQYKNHPLNASYYTDLHNLILDNPQIKLWTHGHIHHASTYQLGETLVALNPYGYPGEPGVDYHKNLILMV